MIRWLTLTDFKGFHNQRFDLAPLTVFVGRNGTGKSSALQALALLKQSSLAGKALYTREESNGVLADLGRFEDVVHMRDTGLPMGFGLGAELKSLGPTPWPADGWLLGELPARLTYGAALHADREPVEAIRVRSSGSPGITLDSSEKSGMSVGGAVAHVSSVDSFRGLQFNVSASQDALDKLQALPWAFDSGLTEQLDRIGAALKVQLRRFFLVPAMRGFSRQSFHLQDDAHQDLSMAPDYESAASNAATLLAMNRDLEQEVSDWLEPVTGLRLRVEIGRKRTVSIVFEPPARKGGSIAVGANNESFGANQLSHLLLQVALASHDPMVGREAVIGIEEPEAHLHPRAQRELVDTLAGMVEGGWHQLIISTHSDRVVSRLLALVAAGKLSTESLAVYAFDKNEEGVTSAERCEVDDRGRISGSVAGFFEESIADMEMMSAAWSAQGV